MFESVRAALLPLIVVGCLAGIQSARAQSGSAAPPASGPDPADAAATVPVTVYQSVFGAYQRPGADKPIPWKAANDEVGRIGGWRAYAREASQSRATVDASTPPPQTPTAPEGAKPPAGPEGAKTPATPAVAKPPTGGHSGHGQPMK